MDAVANQIVDTLRPYFAGREDVAFSYLFGSAAAGTAGEDSDIDIGVYFYPDELSLDVEETVEFPHEGEIEADVMNRRKRR